MDIPNIISDSISFLSLILSVYAVNRTNIFNKKQEQHNLIIAEVNKLVLREKQKEAIAESSADVSANFIKIGRNDIRFRIFNKGKALARNVSVDFPEGNRFIGITDEKLPINLEQYQIVEFPVAYSLDFPGKIKITLIWDDERKQQNKKEMDVTL